MLPELLNRLTGIFMFPTPTVEQLVKIAKGSVITSYSRLLTSSGLELHVTDAGVLLMAEWAAETKTYARGLKSIMSRLVEEAVFNDAKGKVTFGAKEVRQAITGGVQ
jgi:ATP-dependent Clp protease ATP-binding subunit ClpX